MQKLPMHTNNIADENFKKLAELFPQAVTEVLAGHDENGKAIIERAIDKDVLMAEIAAKVVDGNEQRYQFTWPDKAKTVHASNQPIYKTLRPCREESVNFDDTENLYIEGDNLEVLKLLQESYLGKVKMIYIDPPYNTGNDFVYNDRFTMDGDDWDEVSGDYDEEGNRLFKNTDSNGRFHTDWLNMLYPRLKIARDLLSDDGVIFISIDDNEVHNLRKICDEVFGAGNFIGSIILKSNPRGSQSESQLAGLHDYVIIYAKKSDCSQIIGHALGESMLNDYKFNENGIKYRLLGLRQRGGFWRRSERPNLYYPIFIDPLTSELSLYKDDVFHIEVLPKQPSSGEDGTWRWSKEKVLFSKNELIAKLVNRNKLEVWDIFQKDFLNKEGMEERRTKAKSMWDEKEVNYQNGTIEIKNLVGSSVFSYPKPVYVLKRMIEMLQYTATDIIFDFFSGSATTAHAVMQLNAEDGGKRKFIMVQLPEATDEKSEAYKAGYKSICEIGKERIRRAGAKVKEKAEEENKTTPDIGFRVLKVDSTNMGHVYYTPKEYTQNMLVGLEENIKKDRTPEDLLFQVMLELAVPLSSRIEELTIDNTKVFSVESAGQKGYLMACFDSKIQESTVEYIAKERPYYFVMRDSSIATDSLSTNFEQIFATYSPDTQLKVL